MAMSLRLAVPVFTPTETPSFTKLSSSFGLRLTSRAPVGIRAVRAEATTESGKKVARGITKPKKVSPEMQAFLGVEEIPRTQVLKHIWAYIKQHDLQDPANKKVVVCDEKLKTIFAGKDRVGFLEIAGLIGPHFLK